MFTHTHIQINVEIVIDASKAYVLYPYRHFLALSSGELGNTHLRTPKIQMLNSMYHLQPKTSEGGRRPW